MIDILIPSCKSCTIVQKQIDEIKSNTKIEYTIITSHLNDTCSVNRNKCHERVSSDIIISLDDDITGFYPGWASTLIEPLEDENVMMVSARLITSEGKPAIMMQFASRTPLTGMHVHVDKEFPGSCIAFRKNTIDEIKKDPRLPYNIPFDENYIRSCFEDTDICKCIELLYPQGKFILNNNVRVIHINEWKWRSKDRHKANILFQKNRTYFVEKWKKLGIEVKW